MKTVQSLVPLYTQCTGVDFGSTIKSSTDVDENGSWSNSGAP